MSGNQKSYLQSQLDKFEEMMNDFDTSIGLGNLTYNPEVDAALSFSFDQLNTMDAESCLLYAYKLEQYALFLQARHNRMRNVKNWAKNNLTLIVAKEGKNYGTQYTKYEEKVALVCAGDSYAAEINSFLSISDCKAEELEMMANRVSNMSRTLNNLYMARK